MAFLLIALLSADQPSFAENAYETVGRRFTILPLSGFSSDDGPGYGFRAAMYIYDENSSPYRRAYSLQAFFTTKGKWAHQVQVDCPQIALGNRLDITLRHDKEETTSYSGDLNNSQLSAFTTAERTFQKIDPYLTIRWIRDLQIPWRIQYRLRLGKTRITPNDPTTNLIGQLGPLGYDGVEIVQASVSVRYDTRDNYINSHAERLDEVGLEWGVGAGGDFNGGKLSLQHRHFARVHDRVLFAQRFLATFTVGDVPFYEQPKLGSSRTLRGPSADRYRDEARILTNTEVRWIGIPISKRNQVFGGLNFFGDVGQVFRRSALPSADDWKLGVGAGLRLYWYSTVVRADYAVSNGDSVLYTRFAQIF